MKNQQELHNSIIKEITDERNREIEQFLAKKKENNASAERKHAQANEFFKSMNIDTGKLEIFQNSLAADDEKNKDQVRKKYAGDENAAKIIDQEQMMDHAITSSQLPCDAKMITPSYAAIFSTKDKEEKLAGGTGTAVPNYKIVNAWDWAKGAGNGWFGSGAGSYQVWVEFGFWYLPKQNRYYSIVPSNLFRGFYIVKANDGFWDSKYARVVIDIWTNVYQYNWKGWSQNRILDVGDDNINVNNRFDTTRNTYNSALLGAEDWTYVRNYVSLYVYARGGGSYAELNFATGAANYLSCPYCYIY